MKIYFIDAFTNQLFKGNSAAVVPLEKWLDDEKMQLIAAENNLSETAFFVQENNTFYIRWFTPTVEVDLCGHATLATAFVIFNFLNYTPSQITFNCKIGELKVTKNEDWITLNFPSEKPKKINKFSFLEDALKLTITEAYEGKTKFMVVVDKEDIIQNYIPNFSLINRLEKNIIITAKGNDVDFVSRFFAPQSGIDEDPVTGSAHCLLIPFWAEKLNKQELTAKQLSKRGGFLKCKYNVDRVEMSGQAVCYLIGDIL